MAAVAGIDQLRRYAHTPAGLAHASFQHESDLQLTGHLPDADRLTFESEDGIAREHVERRDLGEVGYDILGDSVAEVLLLRIGAYVGEGQHSDRKLVYRLP